MLGDLLDKNFRRGLVLSDGSFLPFLTRPISLVLWLLIAVIALSSRPLGPRPRWAALRRRRAAPAPSEP